MFRFSRSAICAAAATAAAWLILSTAARAEDLVLGNLDLSLSAFSQEELRTFPDNGQADVAKLLKKRGFDLPEGGCAFYDVGSARIFLRSTPRDVRRLEKLAADHQEISPDQPVQVRVQAVCYAVPVSALPPDFGPSSSLDRLPAEKLEMVDRASLICRGGQRAKTEHTPPEVTEEADEEEENPREKENGNQSTTPGKSARPASAQTERSFEIECTVNDDRLLLDINMAWEISSPQLAPAGDRGFFKLTNQVLLRPQRVVTQELGITSEPEPRLVILALQAEVLPPAAQQAAAAEIPAASKPQPPSDK